MPPSRHLVRAAALASSLLCALPCHLSAQWIHSPQVNLPPHRKPEDLSWLTAYAQPAPTGRAGALLADPRFSDLLRRTLAAPQTFWNEGEPLPTVAHDFLSGPASTVLLAQNRFLCLTGDVAAFPANRGLLWIDLGLPHPLLVFSALDWISDNRTPAQPDAAWTLWLFPSRTLDPHQLPQALVSSIMAWTASPALNSTTAPNVTRVFLIDPDGTPHPLSPGTVGAHNTLPPETSDTTKVPS